MSRLIIIFVLLAVPAFAVCPPNLPRPKPGHAKATAPVHRPAPVVVGQTRTFWAWDFAVMPPGFRRVQATCRAAGARGLVFVEDSEWGTRFTETDLAKVTDAYEKAGGIGQVVSETFAAPPVGMDGEPRVILLFTAMASFNNASFDGYFNAFDTLPESEAVAQYQQHSNEAEILYLNTRGSGPSSQYMLGVISHELAHLVGHQFDDAEVSWLDESLGEAAMIVCGYITDIAHMERFCKKPETPLVTDGYVSYGACFLFGAYLFEQLGPQALGQILRDPKHGAEGLEATLAAANRGPFAAFHRDWALANVMAAHGAILAKYRYYSFDVPELTVRTVETLPAEDAAELKPHQVRYVKVPPGVYFDASMVLEPSGTGAHLIAAECCGSVAPLLQGNGTAELYDNVRYLVTIGDAKVGYRLTLTPRP